MLHFTLVQSLYNLPLHIQFCRGEEELRRRIYISPVMPMSSTLDQGTISECIGNWSHLKNLHNRTQTVCDLACRKGLDVLDLPPDIQPHLRRSSSRTIIVSKIVHRKTLHKFGASLKSLLAKIVKLFSRLLSFCQLLRWELLVGGECIFHIIGIAHDKSSWLLDDFLQSFMKAHGPLKISAIGNWSVLLQCRMNFCAAIVPNTKRISVKLSKANTIQIFFFVCVLYIKRTRFSGEIELRYLIGKTLMEPFLYASSE
ncbi:hypothetical protein YC2023_091913 [Brassica napus]